MLMWTLERVGIPRAVDVLCAAARQAARSSALDGRRGFEAQAQFQGARRRPARAVDGHDHRHRPSAALLEQLVALPLTDDGRYAGAVARWLRSDVVSTVPGADTTELAVLSAMSGPPSGEGPIARPVTWEGQSYRVGPGRCRAAAAAHRPSEAGRGDARRRIELAARGERSPARKSPPGDVDDDPREAHRNPGRFTSPASAATNEEPLPGVAPAPNAARGAAGRIDGAEPATCATEDLKRVARVERAAARAV